MHTVAAEKGKAILAGQKLIKGHFTNATCKSEISVKEIMHPFKISAVGDLYQLRPVAQPPVFAHVGVVYAWLHKSGSLWLEKFKMINLDEIMRQRGDSKFTELLCHCHLYRWGHQGAWIKNHHRWPSRLPSCFACIPTQSTCGRAKQIEAATASSRKYVVIKSIDKDKDKHT